MPINHNRPIGGNTRLYFYNHPQQVSNCYYVSKNSPSIVKKKCPISGRRGRRVDVWPTALVCFHLNKPDNSNLVTIISSMHPEVGYFKSRSTYNNPISYTPAHYYYGRGTRDNTHNYVTLFAPRCTDG